jgi:hypothetical protein
MGSRYRPPPYPLLVRSPRLRWPSGIRGGCDLARPHKSRGARILVRIPVRTASFPHPHPPRRSTLRRHPLPLPRQREKLLNALRRGGVGRE